MAAATAAASAAAASAAAAATSLAASRKGFAGSNDRISRGVAAVAAAVKTSEGAGAVNGMSAARQRRLEKTRRQRQEREEEAEKRFQEFSQDVVERYPEMMDLLDDSRTATDPEELARKVEERLKSKFGDLIEEKRGSSALMDVVVKEIDPFDLNIWMELERPPSEDDLNTIGSVVRAWFVIGKLGGYNSGNLQLSENADRPGHKYQYDAALADDVLMSAMHNIGDLEFQDNLGRIWLDMGTADMLALDVLVNTLVTLSSDHVGIRRLTIGGKKMDEWEEGMKRPEDGYKKFEL